MYYYSLFDKFRDSCAGASVCSAGLGCWRWTELSLHNAPPPKNVECDISEYVDCKKGTFFFANNLLIAKFPQPSSHTSNTVDKLNKSKLL